jgi:hypothetical protein
VLSDDLREELAAIAPARECDRLAELSGLFHVAGRAHLRGRGSVDVHLDVSSSTVARRAFALLRSLGVTSEIRTYRRRAFDQATRYQLHVEGSESAYEILNRAGVLDRSHRPLDRPPQRVVARRCCAAAYLRGALLGSGTLSGPRGPHLEIRTAEAEGARYLAGAAERLGAELRVQDRASHATAYAKGTEAIADVLVAVGAVDLVLALEEQAVLAATRADANRLANADHANLVRTSRAAPCTASISTLYPTICRRSHSSDSAIRPPRPLSSPAAASPDCRRRAPTGDFAVCRSFRVRELPRYPLQVF